MVVNIETYKNFEISDNITLQCMPEDKNKERVIKKDLRKITYMEMKEYKKKDLLTEKETEKLLELTKTFRELKKPLMNEDIFYGFDDLADEYDYGRDIYREDVYETHPDLLIPFETRRLSYIPKGPFEEKFTKMDGYFTLGKTTDCLLKYKVNLTIKNPSEEEETERLKEEQKLQKKAKKKNKNKNKNIIDDNTIEEENLNKELKKYNVFNDSFNARLRNCYANKAKRKELKKDQISFPMHGVKVRVYILRALNLTAQDNMAGYENFLSGFASYCKANSYLELILGHKYDIEGNKQIKYHDDVLNYVPNTLNPSYFKYFELDGDLPQDWKLTINVRTKKEGQIGKGSLIGSTTIDIEDRYIGEKKNLKITSLKSYEDVLNVELETGDEREIVPKLSLIASKLEDIKTMVVPIEYRPLHHPERRTAQGILEMFIEVMSIHTAKLIKPAKIEPPPPQEFELRFVIWECKNLFQLNKVMSVFLTVAYKPEGWLSSVSL